MIVNVEAAIFHEGKWLLIKRGAKETHAAGILSLVGGKVEVEGNGTNVLEAALKREVAEEVGIEIGERMAYVQSTSFVTDDGQPVVDLVFLCDYVGGEAIANSPDEVEAVYRMSYEEIMSHPDAPIWLKESIERAEQVRRERST
ncbi:MAG: NUDIX domain-containing protein [Tumebacillaceae bacterium]